MKHEGTLPHVARRLGTFTTRELAEASGSTISGARVFCRRAKRAGDIFVVRRTYIGSLVAVPHYQFTIKQERP